MPIRVVATVEKLTGPKGELYRYFIRPGSRDRPWRWFGRDEAPPFEGPSARFEIERHGKLWRFIRRVEGP